MSHTYPSCLAKDGGTMPVLQTTIIHLRHKFSTPIPGVHYRITEHAIIIQQNVFLHGEQQGVEGPSAVRLLGIKPTTLRFQP